MKMTTTTKNYEMHVKQQITNGNPLQKDTTSTRKSEAQKAT